MVTLALPSLVSQFYPVNPFFRIARLQSYDCVGVSVLITLYRTRAYILKKESDNGRTIISEQGEWSLDNNILHLTIRKELAEYSIIDGGSGEDGGTTKLRLISASPTSTLDGIELKQVSGRQLTTIMNA